MINDKVKPLVEFLQEALIFTFFDTPFFLYPLHLFKDKPSLFLRDASILLLVSLDDENYLQI